MVDQGYSKAQSDNLPIVDAMMIASYFANNPCFVSAEMRGVKTNKSGRAEYGDNAVGYVQLKREGDLCTVRGRITPEHKVRSKPYTVSVICDEEKQEIKEAICEDCAASSGGCKHIVAFIMWIHRRSEEPSPTSVKCYWTKSKLSSVGTSVKFIAAQDVGSKKSSFLEVTDGSFFNEVTQHLAENKVDCQIMNYFGEARPFADLNMHSLIHRYKKQCTDKTFENFLSFCKSLMTIEKCRAAAQESSAQSDSTLWKALRYGRITASKAYEASRCKTLDGVLVETILGAYMLKETLPIKRGREIESLVLKEVSKKKNIKISKCGLFLSNMFPVLGASPDGISENRIIEIKCPTSEKSKKAYFSSKDRASPKYMAQIQLQMCFAQKDRAFFCVASPDFESTKNVSIVEVLYDQQFCNDLIEKCIKFWSDAIFKKLVCIDSL